MLAGVSMICATGWYVMGTGWDGTMASNMGWKIDESGMGAVPSSMTWRFVVRRISPRRPHVQCGAIGRLYLEYVYSGYLGGTLDDEALRALAPMPRLPVHPPHPDISRARSPSPIATGPMS